MPPIRITKLRFPDGNTEYRTTPTDLRVGTVVRSRGKEWVVASSISDGLAVLGWLPVDGDRAAADGDGTPETLPADPMVQRGPTGDEPMVLEALEAI